MRILLKDFLRAYTLLGRKIVIISDMARKKKDVTNFMAGADVLHCVYNKLGYYMTSVNH
jgi:hypothetical protein